MNKKIKWTMIAAMMASSLHAVVVTNIAQLDSLATNNGGFSFSAFGDNNGYAKSNYQSGDNNAKGMAGLEDWVKAKDKFILGVGDHAIGTRKNWYQMNETDSFFHNHYYPSLGDNCNGTDYFYGSTGDQAVWGRGWVMFKALHDFFDRSNSVDVITFRQPGTAKVYSSKSKAEPNVLVPYDDQLCDYYAKRKQGLFTFHIISVNCPDPGVLASVSKNFMINKLNSLATTKTDYDVIIVMAQKASWVKRAQDAGWLTRAERDTIMNVADLVLCGDDHVYRRQNNFDADYDGTEALWMNVGQPCASTGSGRGYLNFHMFDNPPRFTVQYIMCEASSRALHVNAVQIGSLQKSLPAADTKPWIKYINGPRVSVDWNNFPINATTTTVPVVSFSVPSGNITTNAGSSLYVKVNATDPNGISQVRLYKNGVKLARDEGGSPYEWGAAGQNDPELQNLTAGSFVLTAQATDTQGTIGSSSAITVTVQQATAIVPWVTNMTQAAAGAAITNAGLVVSGVNSEYHATVPAGQIFSQTPGGGTTVNAGSSVALAVSLGVQMVTVPWVTNLTEAAASASISAANLQIGNITSNYHATVPAGQVYSQTPAGGTSVEIYSDVDIAISMGVQGVVLTSTTWSPTSGASWTNTANWSAGSSPRLQSQNLKVQFVGNSATEADLRTNATVAQLVMGDSGTTTTNKLRLYAGANLICGLNSTNGKNWTAIGYNRPSALRVDSNAVLTAKDLLMVGRDGGTGIVPNPSYLDVLGGTATVEGTLRLGNTDADKTDGGGYVTVDNSGVLNVTGSLEINDTSIGGSGVNVRKGTINLTGNQTNAVKNFITAGLIVGFGGNGSVNVLYNSTSNKTVVTATSSNLVKNSSFETNTTNWVLTGSAARSTNSAGSGIASLRINTANSMATQQIAIVSGVAYDISVKVNVSARTAGMVVFDTSDKYDAAGQGQFTFSATNGGWKTYSGSFTATNSSVTLRMFSDGTFAGTAYFDQVELKVK